MEGGREAEGREAEENASQAEGNEGGGAAQRAGGSACRKGTPLKVCGIMCVSFPERGGALAG